MKAAKAKAIVEHLIKTSEDESTLLHTTLNTYKNRMIKLLMQKKD